MTGYSSPGSQISSSRFAMASVPSGAPFDRYLRAPGLDAELASYAAEVHPEHHIELPFSHWGFGGIALALFMAMLGALWSFRGTAAKVPHSVDGDGHHADGHGTTDVSTRH